MKIYVEGDNAGCCTLEMVIAPVVGLAIGWVFASSDNLGNGLVRCVVAGIAWLLAVKILLSVNLRPLPADAQICVAAVLHQFRDEYPEARVSCVALRDTNEERFIVTVYYKWPNTGSRPAPRMYYAVNRRNHTVTLEIDPKWWPRGLK